MPSVVLTGEKRATEPQDKATNARRRSSLRMLFLLPVLVALVFLLSGFTHNFIPSESMEPALRPGDHIITMRSWLAYPGGSMPARGDIIVFRLPKSALATDSSAPDNGTVDAATRDDSPGVKIKSGAKSGAEILIKRVIGLPGDEILIKDNDVYVNGKRLKEPYPVVPIDDTQGYGFPYAVFEPLRVPPGHLFVLGDNRNNSDDGRYWGTLPRTDVVGKYLRVLYHEKKYDGAEAAVPTRKE